MDLGVFSWVLNINFKGESWVPFLLLIRDRTKKGHLTKNQKERVGLHQCFPGCGMCQVNEVILGGIALDGRPWTHRGACNNAAMLEFNNTVCFIFMVIIYVSDTEFSIYTIYKISLK